MDKLVKVGIFKGWRDIVKPTTMVTNYSAGERTTITESSKELTQYVIDFLLSHDSKNQEGLDVVIDMINDGDKTILNGNKNLTGRQIANIKGVNEAIEKHFAKKGGLAQKLREHIDGSLNGIQGEYKGRVKKVYEDIIAVHTESKLEYSETGARGKSDVPLMILPANAAFVLNEKNKDGSYKNSEHVNYGKKEGDKGFVEKGTPEYRAYYVKMLDKYGMPITSKNNTIVQSKTGKDVIVTKEGENYLTAIVNAIHSEDSAIFFLSHERTIEEINKILKDDNLSIADRAGYNLALQQASGMIHDANNGNPYYNEIYQKHYRNLTFEISQEYDVEEQLALLYDYAVNGEVEGKSLKGSNAGSKKTAASHLNRALKNKESKAEIIETQMDRENYKIFGFDKKIEAEPEPEPDPTKNNEDETETDTETEPNETTESEYSGVVNRSEPTWKTLLKKTGLFKKAQNWSRGMPSGRDSDTRRFNKGDLEAMTKHADKIKEYMENGTEIVVLDVENSYDGKSTYVPGKDGTSTEILDMYAKKVKYNKKTKKFEDVPGSEYKFTYKPSNPKSYNNSVDTNIYMSAEEFNGQPYTNQAVEKELNDMLNKYAGNGKVPIMAYNGITADFSHMSQFETVAQRMNNDFDILDAQVFTNVELFKQDKDVPSSETDTWSRKQSDVAKRLGVESKDSKDHTGEGDVNTMVSVVESLYNMDQDATLNDNTDTKVRKVTKISNPIVELANHFGKKSPLIAKFMEKYATPENLKYGDRSVYSLKDHSVELQNNAKVSKSDLKRSLEHEIVHFFTAGYLAANPNTADVKAAQSALDWMVQNKDMIMKRVPSHIKPRIEYFLDKNNNRNLAEMVAVLKTEPQTVMALKHAVKKPGIIPALQRFASNVLRYTFDGKAKLDIPALMNALDSIIESGEAFNATPQAEAGRQRSRDLNKEQRKEGENDSELLRDNDGSKLSEALKTKKQKKPNNEPFVGPVTDTTNIINNYAYDIIANVTTQSSPYVIETVKKAHEYMMENYDVYNDQVGRTVNYWESADWLQSMKGYLDKSRFGEDVSFQMNQMVTLAMQGEQRRKSTEDKRIANLNKLMKGLSKQEKKDVYDVTAVAPIFHLINEDGDMKKLIDGEVTIEELISKYEAEVGSTGTSNKAKRLAGLLTRDIQPVLTDSYNIDGMRLEKHLLEPMRRLTALYAMNSSKNASKTLKLLKNNPKLSDTIQIQSKSLKQANDDLYSVTGDRSNYKENLIYEQYDIPKEFKIVNHSDLVSEVYKRSNGWKVLRSPKGKDYGVVYRDVGERTFQPGAGTSLHYQSSDVFVPNDKKIKGARHAVSVGFGKIGDKTNSKDNTMHKVVLTKEEVALLEPLDNAGDALVRAYGRLIELKDTQAIRDDLIAGMMTKRINSKKSVMGFNNKLKKMKTEERPVFLSAPDVLTAQEILEKYPEIAKHYKVAENVSNVSGLDRHLTFVRKDASDMILGYQDPVLFENSPTLRKASYTLRQLVKLTKIHWIVTNGPKIFVDGASNVAILLAYGVPITSMPKSFGTTLKDLKSLETLRLKLLDHEMDAYAGVAGSEAKVKAVKKRIQAHPLALMYNNGMLQSMSTEILAKDESVISGLQSDIEHILNKVMRNKKGKNNDFSKGIKALAQTGWNIDDILIWAGKSVKNVEHLEGLGRGLIESGGRIRTKKKSGDMAKYVSEYIASPDSELVRLGSALVQVTDILPRKLLLDYFMAQGMPQKEALSKSLDAFVDYKVNMPKELKVMSDYAILLFPSFWMRIQKVIWSTLKASPATTPAALALTEAMELEFETIFASNIFSKLEMNPFHTPPIGADTFLPLDLFGF